MIAFEKYVRGSDKSSFISKVGVIADKLSVKPDWLMTVFAIETVKTFKPDIYSIDKNAVGLIQFIKGTCENQFGLTLYQMSLKSRNEQLDYVYKYFFPYKGKIKDVYDAYLVVFFPAALGKPDEFILKTNTQSAEKIRRLNPGFDVQGNNDGVISRKEVKNYVRNYVIENKFVREVFGVDNIADIERQTDSDQYQAINENKVLNKKNVGFFTYIHTDSNLVLLDDIIRKKGWVKEKSQQFIDFNSVLDFRSNRKNVQLNYTGKQFENFQNQEQNYIPVGTSLDIPNYCLNGLFQKAILEGNTTISSFNDLGAFIPEKLKKLSLDLGYVKRFEKQLGGVSKNFPQVSVWIWCKALGVAENSNIEGQVFDISPFIKSVSTNVTETGGNFSIELAPITCECQSNGWFLKSSNLSQYKQGSENSYVYKDHIQNDQGTLNEFLFHTIVGSNDVVFIRFERLVNENREVSNNFIVDKDQLAGNNYDMVGLVDDSNLSYNAGSNNVSVQISGRDLMKLLIEDYLYFPESPGDTNEQGVFVNENPEEWGRLRKRYPFSIRTETDVQKFDIRPVFIEEITSLIFSSLANIEVAPDSLFSSWGDRRSTYQAIDKKKDSSKENNITTYRAAGIWQIVKVVIDKQVRQRYVINDAWSTSEGSLLQCLQQYYQKPFVELMSDTYGDQFYFTIRKQPFDFSGWTSLIDFIEQVRNKDGDSFLEIKPQDLYDLKLDWYNGEVYSWYRLNPFEGLGANKVGQTFIQPCRIVFFRQYAEIWGNKPFELTSNYLSVSGIGPVANTSLNDYNDLYVKDLKYIVESNAYLPFTKIGTITIKADRRIKRGMCIRLLSTNEIYYVDSVTQSRNIGSELNSTTTLQVSRGMKEFEGTGDLAYKGISSYFNIIDFKESRGSKPKQEIVVESRKVANIQFDTDAVEILVSESSLTDDDEKDSSRRTQLRESNQQEIDRLALDLYEDHKLTITIEGHTDIDPTKYLGGNLNLSKARAEYVKLKVLIAFSKKNGFADYQQLRNANKELADNIFDRISTVGKGDSVSLNIGNRNSTDVKKKERRVEVVYKTVKDNDQNTSPETEDNSLPWKVNDNYFTSFLLRRQMCRNVQFLINDVQKQSVKEEVVSTNNSDIHKED